jgi:hypothetical protein
MNHTRGFRGGDAVCLGNTHLKTVSSNITWNLHFIDAARPQFVRHENISSALVVPAVAVSPRTPALRATKSNGKPLTSRDSAFEFPGSLLRGRAALLDGVKLSVIAFWQVHYRSTGAKQALEFFCEGLSKV